MKINDCGQTCVKLCFSFWSFRAGRDLGVSFSSIPSFYRWQSWDPERLSDSPMVTQTVWGKTITAFQIAWLLVLGNLYYILLLLPADVILGRRHPGAWTPWTSREKERCRMHRRAGHGDLVGGTSKDQWLKLYKEYSNQYDIFLAESNLFIGLPDSSKNKQIGNPIKSSSALNLRSKLYNDMHAQLLLTLFNSVGYSPWGHRESDRTEW